MFALRTYLAAPCPAVAADLSALRSRVYRFQGGVPDLRLPKNPSGLSAVLAGSEADAAWLALSTPQGRVPLAASAGQRRVALLIAIEDDAGVSLACVILTVVPPSGRYGQPVLEDASVSVARDRDGQVEMLAALWAEADPVARAEAGGEPAVWLGNDVKNPGSSLHDAVRALGAVYGLNVEVVPVSVKSSETVVVSLFGSRWVRAG